MLFVAVAAGFMYNRWSETLSREVLGCMVIAVRCKKHKSACESQSDRGFDAAGGSVRARGWFPADIKKLAALQWSMCYKCAEIKNTIDRAG